MAEDKKKNTGTKGKTSMLALVQAGKEEAEKVQHIKSVSTQQTTEERFSEEEKTAQPVTTIIEQKEPIEQEVIEESKTTSLKGLSMLFEKREVKDTEAVKIPREFHQELKMLSTMSKTSMMQMLGNLIEAFLEENQKEIASYKRKYLNGTLGKK